MNDPGADNSTRQQRSLRILMIGGAGFIGSHHVRMAHARGYAVTVLSRRSNQKHGHAQPDSPSGTYRALSALKSSNRSFPADVEFVAGDLYGDLSAIENRFWDVVIDFAQFAPQGIRNLGKSLRNRIGRYILISTISTYSRRSGDLDERSPQLEYDDPVDPFTLRFPNGDLQYGALKVLCEREAEAQFPGKCLIIRAGLIVGPDATSDFLSFWIARMEQGGEIAVPGHPQAQVQLLDARDLAEWVIRMVEQAETGIYNSTGPMTLLTNTDLMDAVHRCLSSTARLTWIPSQWLVDHKINARTAPLFWTKEPQHTQHDEHWVSHAVSSQKAYAKGLKCRPLLTTVADTILSFKALPRELQLRSPTGWGAEQERQVLALWHETRKRLADHRP